MPDNYKIQYIYLRNEDDITTDESELKIENTSFTTTKEQLQQGLVVYRDQQLLGSIPEFNGSTFRVPAIINNVSKNPISIDLNSVFNGTDDIGQMMMAGCRGVSVCYDEVDRQRISKVIITISGMKIIAQN